MKKLSVAAIFAGITLLSGCSSYSVQTATAPISAERARSIQDGVSTRLDVISLFGNPNGFNPTVGTGAVGMVPMMNQQMFPNAPKTDKILHYKDCIATSAGKAGILSGSVVIPRSAMTEVCKVFTALLDDNDVVVAHVYLDNNFVSKEKAEKIHPGMTNADVIRILGGPDSITVSGDVQIYMYSTCISKSSVSAWNPYNTSIKNRRSCQQTTIQIKDGVVQRANFIPWDDSAI